MDIGCAPLPYWGVSPDMAADRESCRPKAVDLPPPPTTFNADEGLISFPVVACRADVRLDERFCGDWVAMLIGEEAVAIARGGEEWPKRGKLESSKSESSRAESR